jgi:50S ribosomal protein L16 3-hydroxylase
MFTLPQDFFERYWQREPLLIRDAVPGFRSPLEPDELAGFAYMEEAESRIVIERGCAVPWEVRYGPFAAADFETLPDTHWTLLVQAVDHWDDEVTALRRAFPQIPDWRIDDVMVSYAAPGGSVGPHYDQYDVFLLQGLGRRRWMLGGAVQSDAALQPHSDLRLLRDFTARTAHVLSPGDALYLPPAYAHWGIAEDECMTYSIGFRAPSAAEIIELGGGHIADHLDEHARYTDLPLAAEPDTHHGEITAEVLERIAAIAQRHLGPGALGGWLGSYSTARKYPFDAAAGFDEATARQRIEDGSRLRPCRDSRFAFIRGADHFDLYADGYRHRCPAAAEAFVRRLCEGAAIEPADMTAYGEIVLELMRYGSVEAG